jgi:general secretion pathway protein N
VTPRARIGLAGGVGLAFAILLLPLSVALPMAMPRDSGLSAARALGTIWSGTLRDARLAGMPLGDTRVGLLPLALLTGEARLWFEAPTLRGTLFGSRTNFGIANASGPIDVAVRVKPLPLTQVVLDDASARFRDLKCASAEGRVSATVAGDIGGVALPGGMTGTLKCDGGALLVPLVGQSGMERVDLRVTGDGKWRGEIAIRTGDPAVVAKLVAAGFVPGPRGFALRLTGQL